MWDVIPIEILKCEILAIIYMNDTTGYTVAPVKAFTGERTTIVGTIIHAHEGMKLECHGEWVEHKQYGRQFQVSYAEEILPDTIPGILNFLGGGLFDGIGPATAKRIVNVFGQETLEIIAKYPDRLHEVPGIGKKKASNIVACWNRHHAIRDIMLFLQGFDIGLNLAMRIYRHYGKDSIPLIKENPYRLADDIAGIGFKQADAIAKQMGYNTDSPHRLRSGIVYVLKQAALQGHCFLPRYTLIATASELLGVEKDLIHRNIEAMLWDEKLIQDMSFDEPGTDFILEAVYLPSYYRNEDYVAHQLTNISKGKPSIKVSEASVIHMLKHADIDYDPIQVEALRAATADNKVMVLTGGPGTGKTTITEGIISLYENAGADILLAAPTGRAAKRLSETTGREAKTIHRLLEFCIDGFMRDASNPLDGDLLIVDESSMIDINLMASLVDAIPKSMRLILVGDVDQLPSVGAGNVLRDIIESESVRVVRLETIFRQAQNSRIITNAHAVNHGIMPEIHNCADSDFFFTSAKNAETAADKIVDLVANRLPSYCHTNDIQVLVPMKKGACGTIELNKRLQEKLNPFGAKILNTGFRENDKVMQIVNNYDKGVFNGDIGRILRWDDDSGNISVQFDGNVVEYTKTDLSELVLAYAITIHKSQGSEYPVVVLPLLNDHYIMLQRNLLYTGITRAKEMFVLVGDSQAVHTAVNRANAAKRNTLLKQRLQQTKNEGD